MISIKTRILIAAPLAAAFALPAIAGGLTEPVPEPIVIEAAPVYAPASDWSGAYVGAQLGYGDVSSGGAGLDGNGAIGGVHAGYRYDFGQVVAGAEIDYDKTKIDLGAAGNKLDAVSRLKLMMGADLGRTLVYGTAGAAHAKARVAGADLSDNGYFLGAGADYALTDQWTMGAEVLGHRFNNFAATGVDLKATTVTARIGYKF